MEGETLAASFPTGALRKSSSSETRNSFHARSRSSVETRNPLSIKKVTVACHTGPRSRILPCCESPISHRNSFSPFDTRAFAEGAATAAGVAFIRVLATQLIACSVRPCCSRTSPLLCWSPWRSQRSNCLANRPVPFPLSLANALHLQSQIAVSTRFPALCCALPVEPALPPSSSLAPSPQ